MYFTLYHWEILQCIFPKGYLKKNVKINTLQNISTQSYNTLKQCFLNPQKEVSSYNIVLRKQAK